MHSEDLSFCVFVTFWYTVIRYVPVLTNVWLLCVGKFVPGCYALTVTGELSEEMQVILSLPFIFFKVSQDIIFLNDIDAIQCTESS